MNLTHQTRCKGFKETLNNIWITLLADQIFPPGQKYVTHQGQHFLNFVTSFWLFILNMYFCLCFYTISRCEQVAQLLRKVHKREHLAVFGGQLRQSLKVVENGQSFKRWAHPVDGWQFESSQLDVRLVVVSITTNVLFLLVLTILHNLEQVNKLVKDIEFLLKWPVGYADR